METLVFKPGETIFHQGEPAQTAFLIKTGAVRLIRHFEETSTVLATLTRGDIFGEAALMDSPEPRKASARAVTRTELGTFTKEGWESLLARQPEPVRRFMRNLMVWLSREQPGRRSLAANRYPLLEMAAALDLLVEASGGAKLDPSAGPGYLEAAALSRVAELDYDQALERVAQVLGLPVSLAGEGLARLAELEIIDLATRAEEVETVAVDPESLAEEVTREEVRVRVIRSRYAEKFRDRVVRLLREHPELGVSPSPLISLRGLAEHLDLSTARIREMIGTGSLPDSLPLFQRDTVLAWFRDNPPAGVPEDLEPVPGRERSELADLLEAATDGQVRTAITLVGVSNLVHLVAVAEQPVRSRIMTNLSSEEAARLRAEVGRLEARDPTTVEVEVNQFLIALKRAQVGIEPDS